MRFSSGFAIAPFSSASIAANAAGKAPVTSGSPPEGVVREARLREVDEEVERGHVKRQGLGAGPVVSGHGGASPLHDLRSRRGARKLAAPWPERTAGTSPSGIDLGGTKILAGAVDSSEPHPRARQAQDAVRGRTRRRSAAALVEACDLALKEAGAARADVTSFAIAAPGAVDTIKGTLLKAANLERLELERREGRGRGVSGGGGPHRERRPARGARGGPARRRPRREPRSWPSGSAPAWAAPSS